MTARIILLINTCQSGFIKGRRIIDGVVAAQELISSCFIDKFSGGMLLKLDFTKAYDTICWVGTSFLK